MGGRIWKLPCRHCGHHIDVNIDEGVGLFGDAAGEVTEFVWDGSKRALARIEEALPRWHVDTDVNCLFLVLSDGIYTSPNIPHGNRIRIEGDTFSIHPPKDGDA